MVRRRYWSRLSGPLLDRVDLRVNVPAVRTREFIAGQKGESSAVVRGRVEEARARQRARWASYGESVNGRVPGSLLRSSDFLPSGEGQRVLDEVVRSYALTGRGVDRVLRIAWTLADLAGAESLLPEHLAEAAVLRGTAEAS